MIESNSSSSVSCGLFLILSNSAFPFALVIECLFGETL